MALHISQAKAANVPMVLRFSSGQRTWSAGEAKVLGWTHTLQQEARAAFHKDMMAGQQGVRLPVEYSPIWKDGDGFHAVRVTMRSIDGREFTTDMPNSEIPGVPSAANSKSDPDLRFIADFPVVFSQQSAPEKSVELSSSVKLEELRNAFFELRIGDAQQLADFLNRWGEWGDVFDDGRSWAVELQANDPHRRAPAPYLGVMACQRVWDMQSFLRKANNMSLKQWFRQAPPEMARTQVGVFPKGEVKFEDNRFVLEDVMLSNVLLDMTSMEKLGGRRFRFCSECGNLYEQKTEHKRKYCDDPRCGTRVRVREYRKKKRREAASA